MKLDLRQSLWRKRIDRFAGIPLVLVASLFRFVLSAYFRTLPPKRKILLIKLSALGDAVCLLPSIYRLRESFKDAEIVFLGSSSNASFLKNSGVIDRFEMFSAKNVMRLSREKFSVIIDYEQWMRATAVISALSRARLTCGFQSPRQFRHGAYDLSMPIGLGHHMGENFWRLTALTLKKVGIPVSATFVDDRDEVRKRWRIYFVEKARREVQLNLLKEPYAIIHPGCGEGGQPREWPLENWLQSIEYLKGRDPKLNVYITGQGNREEAMGAVLSATGAVSLVNKLNPSQLILALSGARHIFVGNTGVMHLASFIGDSLILINGPTNSALWGPLWKGQNIKSPLACAPCLTWGHDYGCSDAVCLKAIPPWQVMAALEKSPTEAEA